MTLFKCRNSNVFEFVIVCFAGFDYLFTILNRENWEMPGTLSIEEDRRVRQWRYI